jgi:hypothetical protein
MRSLLFIPSIILCAVLLSLPHPHTHADEGFPTSTLPESSNQVIKLSDSGIDPQTLQMRKEDGIVFFLNDSADSLVTLELQFGSNRSHCASENLKLGDDGVARSTLPIAPKDFAGTCFHDPGTYAFTVYGLKQAPHGLKGSIVIK